MSLIEIFIFFAPVLLLFVLAIVISLQIGAKFTDENRLKITVVLIFWFLTTLLMLLLTFNYLFGPDCVFCYRPPKIRLAVSFLCGVLLYGAFGLLLVLAVRRGKG